MSNPNEIGSIALIIGFNTNPTQRCYIRDRLWDLFYMDETQRTVYDMIQELYKLEGVDPIPYEKRNDVEFMEARNYLSTPKNESKH